MLIKRAAGLDDVMKWKHFPRSRVTLYTAGHLRTAVPHCSHSRAPIVHTAVPRENNEHGCVYLRCRAVCKLPGCVEGHPCVTGPFVRGIRQSPDVFSSQRPVTRSVDVFFDPSLNKRLSKQSIHPWFDTPSHSLWCHCNEIHGPAGTHLAYQWWVLSFMSGAAHYMILVHCCICPAALMYHTDTIADHSGGGHLSKLHTIFRKCPTIRGNVGFSLF